ncbi:hypothetical protein [Devosia sp. 63-57]|uniref:hypothetical protein n=1 Tax=Devosia sp. 63-57 TaxID=1895751 RepID=UPI000868EA77|nr:hypothetical protein [Devosia sp. 63-57]ODT50292.1 MAG: hypothetical protein ABS74_05075 [Pelagibacterium sp. SCN 63-126]ODU82755.1 MAG: hypothetical protein ABT14_16560 [Pelagibacterium sp. SCN 63-17]OJX45036.1 MAG: hypothetical protein BGO80_04075 [Devosia sp. 63-57]
MPHSQTTRVQAQAKIAALAAADDRPLTHEEQLSRFVEDIITLDTEGGATEGRLYELGWPPLFIKTNLEKAAQLANKRVVRDIQTPSQKSLEEIAGDMSDAIASLLPPTQLLVAELQGRGFASGEIDLLLPKARAKAALSFAEGQTGWTN